MNRPGLGGAPPPVSFSTRTAANGCAPSHLTAQEVEDLRSDLAQVEEEIQTLREVLLLKEKDASEIRRQLGVGAFSLLRQNLSKGWHDVQSSAPYLTASATLEDISHSDICVRTRESLSHAGQVTSAAVSNVGVAITRQLEAMRTLSLPSPPRHTISVPTMRRSPTFRTFEDTVRNVKVRRRDE